jgi:UDP-N-acetylmuramoyl-tripeptide--D-alanyl-D-alanine ligase
MFKSLLIFSLRILAQATLWRYKPCIIGVTGSVGKTSTKEAIFTVLRRKFTVRRNIKNYNNELGVPLTILDEETGGRSFWHWLKVFLVGFFGIFYTKNYPEVLVLEMGADRIGDISYLTSFVKCYIGVVTAIGEIPVHVEFFQSVSQVAREKSNLVRSLDKDGWAVLNFDDERVRIMANQTRARIFSYGFSENVDLRASNFEQYTEDPNEVVMSFKVDYGGNTVPIRLRNILGRQQVYAVLAAVAVGLISKINLVEITQALKDYQPLPGRLRFIKGIKNSLILDDTYNASPSAMLAALDVLRVIPGRKIAALGDMLELGAFTEEAHRQVGAEVAKTADMLLAVGERAIFLADEARINGMSADKVSYFASSQGAGRFLQDSIREGDIILVKGSQGVRMEKIVKEIMAEPERAEELLVRQEAEWQ